MTDWRDVAQDDLEDLDGELCFEDPHQAAWAELAQEHIVQAKEQGQKL